METRIAAIFGGGPPAQSSYQNAPAGSLLLERRGAIDTFKHLDFRLGSLYVLPNRAIRIAAGPFVGVLHVIGGRIDHDTSFSAVTLQLRP